MQPVSPQTADRGRVFLDSDAMPTLRRDGPSRILEAHYLTKIQRTRRETRSVREWSVFGLGEISAPSARYSALHTPGSTVAVSPGAAATTGATAESGMA